MLNMIRAFMRRHVVSEVPEQLSPCLDCDIKPCHGFNACPIRSIHIALVERDRAAWAAIYPTSESSVVAAE